MILSLIKAGVSWSLCLGLEAPSTGRREGCQTSRIRSTNEQRAVRCHMSIPIVLGTWDPTYFFFVDFISQFRGAWISVFQSEFKLEFRQTSALVRVYSCVLFPLEMDSRKVKLDEDGTYIIIRL